ncbi:hypothetical protein M9H77_36446 [Catharanthus roseus]|uniref:Uncharacterized protein n=1 Tax=Catharanthus roseus TaxID=4058 RepID=A0ACB9ZUF1_CATRO|nr:hypothetical protein M9H77_36446 [Catharanthus roseus]
MSSSNKKVLCPVLPKDPGAPLTTPPEYAFTKGRRKTNSTKRDKSYWEHVSIAHRKIGKSTGSGSSSGLGSGSGSSSSSHRRGRPPRAPRGKGRGRSSEQSSLSSKNVLGDGNCGFRVVVNFLFRDENQWPEFHTNMYVSLLGSIARVYELIQRPQWFDRYAPQEYWLDTPDHLYVITNTFNFYVVLTAGLGYRCEMDAHCLLFTCNGHIIVIFESAVSQSLIINRFHIGSGDLVQKHPFFEKL